MSEHLLRCWEQVVREAPSAMAVAESPSGKRWTRAELAESAVQWWKEFCGDRQMQGCRVLMAEPNGARWFDVFLGLMHAGAVAVPADPMEPETNLRTIGQAIGASYLWRAGRLEPLPTARKGRPTDCCLMKVTSGSTGLPKARAFTHAQMLADGRQVCATMGIRPDDINLAIIPLGHSYGLGNVVVPLLAQGTALVCPATPWPHAIAEDCAFWKPTVFPAVPTLLQALSRSSVSASQFQSLRTVISAGALLKPEVAQAFAKTTGCVVHGFYGSSETGGITYDRTGDATSTGRSVGTPMEGVTLNFTGRRFTVSSAAVGGRGSYMPPDYGALNEYGELMLLGRAGRTVKIAGRRLDLAEVEGAMLSVPGVRAACALPHPARNDHVAAVVETDLAGQVLRNLLLEKLATWKIPDCIVAVPALPTTARGKIDRRKAVALLEQRALRAR